jgi:hypothetical protein
MKDITKKKLTYLSIVVVAIFVIFIWPHTYTWDGDGTINVFPISDSVKNYRLEATIQVTRHKNGWMNSNDEYSINSASWLNGSNLDFDNCIVAQDKRTECTGQDGSRYYIEVDSYPDQPEDDYSNSDY